MSDVKIEPYTGPAGGWGSARSLVDILTREAVPLSGGALLLKQNKPDGYMCVSCAWAKPADPHPFEYCENGAKATAWEQTAKRIGPDFFAAHTVSDLLTWPDHDLEEKGRLTHPLRYDPASDRYVAVSWDEAIAEIGRELRALDPETAVFYASGRASLETSYMWALFARLYGHNNLPDSSNMCHETTSVALPNPSASRSARSGSTISTRRIACSSSARMSAPMRPGCCTRCRPRAGAASRSSPSTRCASAGSSASRTLKTRSRC
jgi:anaerobic selenocysteine-containing dehydrogenase